MKRATITAKSKPSSSESNELYENVKILDKSTKSPVELLTSVYKLLDISSEHLDHRQHGHTLEGERNAIPKRHWALRWILRRLSGKYEEARLMSSDIRTWKLLKFLVASLPAKLVDDLLAGHKFVDLVSRSMAWLREPETLETADTRGFGAARVESLSASSENAVKESCSNGNAKTKKRKREYGNPISSSALSACTIFHCIIKLLEGLQEQPMTIQQAEKPWRRKLLMRMSVSQAAQVLGNGLLLFAHTLQAVKSSSNTSVPFNGDLDLLAPLLKLWSFATCATTALRSEDICFAFLESCLIPALMLLTSLEPNRPNSNLVAETQVKDLLASHCIIPFRDFYRLEHPRNKTVKSATGTENGGLLHHFRAIVLELGNNSGKRSRLLDPTENLPRLIFSLAFECALRDTPPRRYQEDPWLQALFVELIGLLGIDLKQSPLAQAGNSQRRQVLALLDIANKQGLKLPIWVLETLAVHASGLSNIEDTNAIDWGLVGACLQGDATWLVAKRGDSNSIALKTMFEKGSAMIVRALPDKELGLSYKQTAKYEIFLASVLFPLLQGFASVRDLESFIFFWSEQLEACYNAGSEKLQDDQGFVTTIWTDERLLNMMSRALHSSMPETSRKDMLLSWSQALEQEQEQVVVLQSIILLECLVWSPEGSAILLPDIVLEDLMGTIWHWLKSIACNKELFAHRWRAWRLLDTIQVAARDTGMEISSIELVHSIIHGASQVMEQCFCGAHSEKSSWYDYNAAFYATRLLRGIARDMNVRGSQSVEIEAKMRNAAQNLDKRLQRDSESQVINNLPDILMKHKAHHLLIDSAELLAVIYTADLLCDDPNVTTSSTQLIPQIMEILYTRMHPGPPQNTSQRQIAGVSDLLAVMLEQSPLKNENRAIADESRFLTKPKKSMTSGRKAENGVFTRHVETLLQITAHSQPLSEGILKELSKALQRLKLQLDQRTAATKLALEKVFTTLLLAMRSTTSTTYFVLAAQNLHWILKHHTWAVSQFNVDMLLSTICNITTTAGKCLDPHAPRAIFSCLCRLFGDVLAGSRIRIVGRWHATVEALSGLLSCLFQPHSSGVTVARMDHQPEWIKSSSQPLDADCATQLSRLLKSLSDPTTSAARSMSGQGQQALNDPTKKARSIAGQYLQYFVMEFCILQLHGRLEPAIRAQIHMGLYSILDVMNQDTMQAMNMALDASSRVLWKALYNDWCTFGKQHG